MTEHPQNTENSALTLECNLTDPCVFKHANFEGCITVVEADVIAVVEISADPVGKDSHIETGVIVSVRDRCGSQ